MKVARPALRRGEECPSATAHEQTSAKPRPRPRQLVKHTTGRQSSTRQRRRAIDLRTTMFATNPIERVIATSPRVSSPAKRRSASRRAPPVSNAIPTDSEMRTHRSRVGAGVAAAAASLALAALNPHAALAVGPVSVPFDDVRYEEVPCEKGTMSSVGGAVNVRAGVACVKFTARATNPSAKPLNNADVYGRVYDDTGSAVTDVAENNRIAYVDVVPAGTGDVTFVLTMGKNQFDAGPLHWQGLKASGFAGKILPGQTGATGLLGENECDLAPDPAECEEERALMANIR